MANGFTDKQRAFIDEYFKNGFNATRAAIAAGYSEKTARFIAAENLSKPNIRQAIDERLAEETISANEALRRLSDHAMGTMEDFVNEAGYIDLEEARQSGKMHLIHSYKHIATDGQERIEVKLYDAQSALKEIIRLHQLADNKPTDRIDVTGSAFEERIEKLAAILDAARDRRS